MIPKKRETDGTAKSQWIAPAGGQPSDGDIILFHVLGCTDGRPGCRQSFVFSRFDMDDGGVSCPGGGTVDDGAAAGHGLLHVTGPQPTCDDGCNEQRGWSDAADSS